jgi:hypothetical protein
MWVAAIVGFGLARGVEPARLEPEPLAVTAHAAESTQH